jgi:hypothetical protein
VFSYALIRYGFRLGQVSGGTDLRPEAEFPKLSIGQFRSKIIQDHQTTLGQTLERFKRGYSHLSFDAGSFHGNTVLDFMGLQTSPVYEKDADFVLFRSVDVAHSTKEFYKQETLTLLIQES